MEEVTLYKVETPKLFVEVKLYFNDENQLVISGYEIGQTVDDILGDSDYEYSQTFNPEEVQKLYSIFGIRDSDKPNLLLEIQNRFGGKGAYRNFCSFLEENEIKSTPFYWV